MVIAHGSENLTFGEYLKPISYRQQKYSNTTSGSRVRTMAYINDKAIHSTRL